MDWPWPLTCKVKVKFGKFNILRQLQQYINREVVNYSRNTFMMWIHPPTLNVKVKLEGQISKSYRFVPILMKLW